MAQTNSLAFPKLSHTSINSPFIHKGSCSILGTATERRATRNSELCGERRPAEARSCGGGKQPGKYAPQLTLLLFSNLWPALPSAYTQPESRRHESPLLQCAGQNEKSRGVEDMDPGEPSTPPSSSDSLLAWFLSPSLFWLF